MCEMSLPKSNVAATFSMTMPSATVISVLTSGYVIGTPTYSNYYSLTAPSTGSEA